MNAQTIKSKLVRRGISQSDIAAELDVTRAAVNGVIIGAWRSRRVEEAVAQRLGMPRDHVFSKGHFSKGHKK